MPGTGCLLTRQRSAEQRYSLFSGKHRKQWGSQDVASLGVLRVSPDQMYQGKICGEKEGWVESSGSLCQVLGSPRSIHMASDFRETLRDQSQTDMRGIVTAEYAGNWLLSPFLFFFEFRGGFKEG